jgi:hypothetical protein
MSGRASVSFVSSEDALSMMAKAIPEIFLVVSACDNRKNQSNYSFANPWYFSRSSQCRQVDLGAPKIFGNADVDKLTVRNKRTEGQRRT